MAKPIEDRSLEDTDANVQAIAAGALVPGGGTAEQVLADVGIAPAARAALGETRASHSFFHYRQF
jgi:hypothetical protein